MQLSFEALTAIVETSCPEALVEGLLAPTGRLLPLRRRLWSGARVDLLVPIGDRGEAVRVATCAHASSVEPEGVVLRMPHRGAFALSLVQALRSAAPCPRRPAPSTRIASIVDAAGLAELALLPTGGAARVWSSAPVPAGKLVELSVGSPAGDAALLIAARAEEVLPLDDGWAISCAAADELDRAAAARFCARHARAPSARIFSGAGPQAQLIH